MGDSLDRVDRYLADWARMRPDLDMSSTAVVGRLRRVTAFAERELDATLAGFGVSRADFDLLDNGVAQVFTGAAGPQPKNRNMRTVLGSFGFSGEIASRSPLQPVGAVVEAITSFIVLIAVTG